MGSSCGQFEFLDGQVGPGSRPYLWKGSGEILALIPPSEECQDFLEDSRELQRSLKRCKTDNAGKAEERTLSNEKMISSSDATRQGMHGQQWLSQDQQF